MITDSLLTHRSGWKASTAARKGIGMLKSTSHVVLGLRETRRWATVCCTSFRDIGRSSSG